jgi:hypothetical protein
MSILVVELLNFVCVNYTYELESDGTCGMPLEITKAMYSHKVVITQKKNMTNSYTCMTVMALLRIVVKMEFVSRRNS